ncbi:hypothetical protein OC846_006295 [Tilletia horrida]|uniref:Uncharacterized protein n=1 Tax=Tilletia horrida TaxID=155126 RepID=A0AAN6JNS2_9BASI|nr:hypothetical protein OC846_006295 [Tilletia horrida]KAK0560070.1 hypothetical protein OC861_006420 [Tilletia horrida]
MPLPAVRVPGQAGVGGIKSVLPITSRAGPAGFQNLATYLSHFDGPLSGVVNGFMSHYNEYNRLADEAQRIFDSGTDSMSDEQFAHLNGLMQQMQTARNNLITVWAHMARLRPQHPQPTLPGL